MSDKTQDRIEKLRQEPAFREIIERLKGIPKDKQQEILEEITEQAKEEGNDHD
jgi:hypothetical protein